MFRVLKSSDVTVDHYNTVTIEVTEPAETGQEPLDDAREHVRREASKAKAASDALAQARREADMIITNAQRDADMILRNAQESADVLAAESEENGYKEGYDKGYSEGAAKAEVLIKEAERTLDDAKRTREQLIDSVEGDLVELILGITNKLLMDAANINPSVILALIKQGISMSTVTGDVIIRVSPDEYDVVVENKEQIAKLVEASSRLEIIKDMSLNTCDCIIETPYGDIDCSLDRQFKTLFEYIYYLYNNSGAMLSADE